MKRYAFSIGIFLLAAGAFWHYGRGFWHPFLKKYSKMKTVESIKTRYETEVWQRLEPSLSQIAINDWPEKLVLIGLKEERILEVWTEKAGKWIQIKTYPFTAFSGDLGPKLREGDRQIPEGLYEIEYLNPNSTYHLSLKVNYPNAFDLRMAKSDGRSNLGGDIFIHGKSVTIGCIPIGDAAIEEVFLLAANAGKGKIEVIIAPRDFRKGEDFPEIEEVGWTKQLYPTIADKLQQFQAMAPH